VNGRCNVPLLGNGLIPIESQTRLYTFTFSMINVSNAQKQQRGW
jgi:hypothetical protein